MNKIITTIFILTAWTGLFAQRTTLPNPATQTPSNLNIKNNNGYQLQGRLVVNDSCWLNGNQVVIPNGNVGIGTVTPTEKLHVNGNIRIDMPNGRIYTDSNEFVIASYGRDSLFQANFTVDGNGNSIGATIYDTTTQLNYDISVNPITGAYAKTAGATHDAGAGSPQESIAEIYAGIGANDLVAWRVSAIDTSVKLHIYSPTGIGLDSLKLIDSLLTHITNAQIKGTSFDKKLYIPASSGGDVMLTRDTITGEVMQTAIPSGGTGFTIDGNDNMYAGSVIDLSSSAINTVIGISAAGNLSGGTGSANLIIGYSSNVYFDTTQSAITLGLGATVNSSSIAIGTSADAGFTNCIALGNTATATKAGQFMIADGITQTVTKGDVIINNSAKGIVLKDNAGTPHYWRVTINSSGVLQTTDLGTTIP